MPVPHIFAGTAGGTTAQLDANNAYLAALRDLFTIVGSSAGFGGSPVAPWHLYSVSANVSTFTRSSNVLVNGASGVSLELGCLVGAAPTSAASIGAILDGAGAGGVWTVSTRASGALTERLRIDSTGHQINTPSNSTPPALTANGQLNLTPTSNTNLRVSYRGSDGVTRVANITLA